MTPECDPIRIDLSALGQREYLKSAGICQDGVRPVHEVMQAAQFSHQVITGAQIEVIGVRQYQAGIQLAELVWCDRFYRGLSANWRK